MTEGITLTMVGAVIGIVLGIAVSGPMTQSLVNSSQDTPTGIQHDPGGNRPQGSMRTSGNLRSIGTQITTNINNVTNTLTPQTFALSIGIVLLITIIGSAVPAWAIARIRPAEVLRTE